MKKNKNGERDCCLRLAVKMKHRREGEYAFIKADLSSSNEPVPMTRKEARQILGEWVSKIGRTYDEMMNKGVFPMENWEIEVITLKRANEEMGSVPWPTVSKA